MPYIDANGLRFHVQVLEDDPPADGPERPKVVMIHGLIVVNLASYYYTIAHPMSLLADTYLYDLRGNGRTEMPSSGYAVSDHVDDLRSLLTAWEIDEPVHLVANSFGGTVALAFTRQFPELVASLVMIDAMLDIRIEPSQASRLACDTSQAPVAGRPDADGGREQMLALAAAFRLDEETIERWTRNHGTRKQNRVVEVSRRLVQETSLVSDLQQELPLPHEALQELDCPVLAIYGEHSDIFDHARALERHVRHCELHVVPDCSHLVLSEATRFVVDKTTAWLSRFGATWPDIPAAPSVPAARVPTGGEG